MSDSERLVALKTIPSWVKITPHALARFDIEARAVARLRHPNIVQIYDVGSLGGRPYLSLEFAEAGKSESCDPGTVARAPRSSADLPRSWLEPLRMHIRGEFFIAISSLRTSWSAVNHRKRVGVLDPAELKIAAFGLARLLDSTRRLTLPGTRVGTPGYMAPEQAQGRIDLIGPATDVYGLGIVLYETLCGRPPFKADSEWAIIHMIVTAPPPPITSFRPDCPPGLEAISLKCLLKKPDERLRKRGSRCPRLAAVPGRRADRRCVKRGGV